MPIRISRNPLAFRPRSKRLQVVVDANNRELGIVDVTVCELPKGLLNELRDDGQFMIQQIEDLSEAIDLAHVKGEPQSESRTKRKEVNLQLIHLQTEVIRWGVCDHKEEDFLEEESGASVPFEEEPALYDGVTYRVASGAMLMMYASAGQPLVKALYDAVLSWQEGEVQTPEEVWSKAATAKAERAARIAKVIEDLKKKQEAPQEESAPKEPTADPLA